MVNPVPCYQSRDQHPIPDYERSAKFAHRVNNAYILNEVSPQWIDDSNCFWYRKDVNPNASHFIYVDPERRLCQPAFDHEQLAKALISNGIETTASKLPFSWIDPTRDGKTIRFRVDGKKWQFVDNKPLTQYDGDIREENLQPLQHEKASEPTTTTTVVTFINHTREPVSLLWIDFRGNTKHYATIDVGESDRRETYVGHVWRAESSAHGKQFATFMAAHDESTAIIEEGMTPAAPIQMDTDPEDNTDSGAGDNSSQTNQVHEFHPFVRDHNVWTRDGNGREIQLSSTGTRENPFHNDGGHLSADGHFAVVYQYTPEQEHTLYHIESTPEAQLQPHLRGQQYLKPGDKIRVDRPRIFDLVNKKEIPTDDSPFSNPYRISHAGWSSDGKEYRFRYNQRGHQVLRLVGMNIDGSVRSIIEETSKTFIDYSGKQSYQYELRSSNEMIWPSERDGWCHLYMYDLQTGDLKNQITRGEWVVRSVDWVDEETRRIWFIAFGLVKHQDPYYAHLARVDFDGSNLTTITQSDATHGWKWSPNRKYVLDTWSRVDLAPHTVVRESDTGKAVVVLEEGNFDKLLEIGWEPAERFAAAGRDGKTLIFGIIITPSNFDSTKRYPVIEDIYAGPQDFHVPKAFSPLIRQHELAELGFVVVQIDGMGTNWRSKAFHNHCYKNLRDAGFPDRIAWMKAAAESRPWLDLTKVGIHGSSAGGQNAMAALLWHGDFYKAAVADSGCHDNRMDKLWWNEAWMGWPVNQQVYEDSSNVVHAKNLKGALMLIVGELDDNVDPASTMQVVNALIEAEKDIDLVFVPGGGHGVGYSKSYCLRRQRDFFIKHLMRVDPPSRNKK